MFDRLTEMIGLISKTKVKRIEIIGEKYNYNTKVQQLYIGIHDGVFKTEEEAVQTLYGTNDITYKAYKQLKYELEQRLINTLFHIDASSAKYTKIQVAHYNGYRQAAIVAILSGRSASKSAIALAKRTLKLVMEYEFTSVTLELLTILLNYSCNLRDVKKFEYYESLRIEQLALYNVEQKAAAYRRELDIYNAKSHDDTYLEAALKYTKELRKLFDNYDSYQFRVNAYLVLCSYYELANNFEKIIEVCEEAIQFFKNKSESNYRVAIYIFLRRKLVYYTTLKNYKEAVVVTTECLNYVVEGSFNWYMILEHSVSLHLHKKDYIKAHSLLIKAMSHKKYKGLHHIQKRQWNTYIAYVNYFIDHHKLEMAKEFKFNPYKFAKDIPSYNKKERDFNIHILVYQIMYWIRAKQYEEVIGRVRALSRYYPKILKDNHTFRGNCLAKMFNVVVQAKFNKIGVIRKAKEYEDKLLAHPLEKSKQASNVEIVPYEHIWDCVLENLQDNFWHKK